MSHLGEAHAIIHNHHVECNQNLKNLVHKTKLVNQDKVKLTSPTAVSVYQDSTPPIADEDDRDGWLFKKVAAADKFNYYVYATGSHPLPLSSLNNVSMTCHIDTFTNSSSIPFIVVYTKATGTGDAGSWYKSRIAYALSSTNKVLAGEPVNLYCLNNPDLNNGCRDMELTSVITLGTADPSEEILTITAHSDSASPINTKILVSHIGYKLNNEITRNIALIS